MKPLRCAIYTRKSSEEGLEQEYNSLDAQRDACEAYVASQKGEGWSALPARYDDGGWSGGSMERPGLRRLLADIEAGRVDIVVVYKVDRLTRSLSDFARMVELFDRREVSFVSVTQAFNTTSSMGRLTLNVLLSFAQFEREVTGERIRDKIAASKARGMWMGGFPPLGYDPLDRKLVVNDAEAELVRSIFRRYLELGSVHVLMRRLAAEGVLSKRWTSSTGTVRGGTPLSRGALFHLLRNRVYLGEIVHKDLRHPGQHAPIVDAEMFDAVQTRLAGTVTGRKARTSGRAPLAGILFHGDGIRMSPLHARNRHGRSYRYYASASLLTGGHAEGAEPRRVSAPVLEDALLERMRRWSDRPDAGMSELRPLIRRVTVHEGHVDVICQPPPLEDWTGDIVAPDRWVMENGLLKVRTALRLRVTSGRTLVSGAGPTAQRPRKDLALIGALRRGHAELLAHGIDVGARATGLDEARGVKDPYLRKLTALAFLAPDIQQAILAGQQPTHLTLAGLLSSSLPIDWDEQRRALGFTTAGPATLL